MKIPKVLIIQPCIPKYRVSFFEQLFSVRPDVSVLCSNKDCSGLVSAEDVSSFENVYQSLNENTLGPFVIQRGVLNRVVFESGVLVVVGNPRYINNFIILFVRRLRGLPTLWWGQGWSAKTSKSSYLVRKCLMKLFDGVILYTEREYQRMSKERIYPKRMTYLNNGLNINSIRFFQSPESNHSFNLIFLGRLTVKSEVGLVLEALKKIPKSINVTFTVIGDGPLKETLCLSTFPENVTVQWIGALYDENIIASHVKQAHFFIYGGAVGLSLIHTMAYGIPSIVHDKKWEHMPEIAAFEDDITGFTFKKGNVMSLVSTICTAHNYTQSPDYQNMRSYCRSVIENYFTTQFMGQQMAKFVMEFE